MKQKIILRPANIHQEEDIVIHNKKSIKRLQSLTAAHPFFKKKIVWVLMKSSDCEKIPPYEDEQAVGEPVYTVQELKTALNGGGCFEMTYTPEEDDKIDFFSVYVYRNTRLPPRPDEWLRHRKCISLTFTNGRWQINEVYERRTTANSITGIVVMEDAGVQAGE
jgi:hypothetical protein